MRRVCRAAAARRAMNAHARVRRRLHLHFDIAIARCTWTFHDYALSDFPRSIVHVLSGLSTVTPIS